MALVSTTLSAEAAQLDIDDLLTYLGIVPGSYDSDELLRNEILRQLDFVRDLLIRRGLSGVTYTA